MKRALDGVKVADFSWVGAGPRSTKDLADNGATVIKIESRKRLDLGRMSPPFKDGKRNPDGSAFFGITNTSKMGVTINLGDPAGIEVAKKLIAWADVVVENFGKGFLDRVGLPWETMQALNPDVILISVSVAGRAGPLSGIRGYGNSAAALSGQAALGGWPDRDPHMPPFAYGDVVAPMYATVATLAALEHRRVTGQGQHIDISQAEPLMHTLGDLFARRQAAPNIPLREANASQTMCPHGLFGATGEDQYLAIAVRNDEEWAALCSVIGAPLTHPTFAERKADETAVNAVVAAGLRDKDKHAAAQRLVDAGIPAAALQNGKDIVEDPELQGRHFIPISDTVLGDCMMPGPPMVFSDLAIEIGPPPKLGEHNREVYVDMLGIPAAEVERLEQSGALA